MNNKVAEQNNDGPAMSASLSKHSKTKPNRASTTKKAQLIKLLDRKSGVHVALISAKLGWQPHTVRAALSGLRKAGFELTAEKPTDGKLARYRITAGPENGVAK